MFVSKKCLDLFSVFVDRFAHHLDTKMIYSLAIIPTIKFVMAFKSFEVYFYEKLREIDDSSLTAQKFLDAFCVEECFKPK